MTSNFVVPSYTGINILMRERVTCELRVNYYSFDLNDLPTGGREKNCSLRNKGSKGKEDFSRQWLMCEGGIAGL